MRGEGGPASLSLTFYGEDSVGLSDPATLTAGLTAPGPSISLLQAGDSQPAVSVGLQPASLSVVSWLEREGVSCW